MKQDEKGKEENKKQDLLVDIKSKYFDPLKIVSVEDVIKKREEEAKQREIEMNLMKEKMREE